MRVSLRAFCLLAGAALLAAAALFAAGGCAGADGAGIEGVTWVLDRYVDGSGTAVDVIADTRVDAYFADGRVSGNAGCNSYSGSYEISGESIRVGPLAATEMFCLDPEGVMEQEAAYLDALRGVTGYRFDGASLVLVDGKGDDVAAFDPE